MSEKGLKLTGIILIGLCIFLAYFAITQDSILVSFICLIGLLYGALLLVSAWSKKPMIPVLDVYSKALAKQKSDAKALALRKKIKIVKK